MGDLLVGYSFLRCSLSVSESFSLWPSLSREMVLSFGSMVGRSLDEKA